MKYLFRKDKTVILSERVEGKQDYYKSFMAFFIDEVELHHD